jgi:hypothetical protein
MGSLIGNKIKINARVVPFSYSHTPELNKKRRRRKRLVLVLVHRKTGANRLCMLGNHCGRVSPQPRQRRLGSNHNIQLTDTTPATAIADTTTTPSPLTSGERGRCWIPLATITDDTSMPRSIGTVEIRPVLGRHKGQAMSAPVSTSASARTETQTLFNRSSPTVRIVKQRSGKRHCIAD